MALFVCNNPIFSRLLNLFTKGLIFSRLLVPKSALLHFRKNRFSDGSKTNHGSESRNGKKTKKRRDALVSRHFRHKRSTQSVTKLYHCLRTIMVAGAGLEPHDLRVFPAAKRLCPACGARNFCLMQSIFAKFRPLRRKPLPVSAAGGDRVFSQRATLVGLKTRRMRYNSHYRKSKPPITRWL